MFLISTRNFPPQLGGMQNLMEGLSNALLNHGPVKVIADGHESAENYDKNSKLNIDRVSGFKIFRKNSRTIKLTKDSNISSLELSVSEKIGLKVEIKNNKRNKGTITFSYHDVDQLNKIIDIVKANY